jgi:hypothetical protein
MPATLKWKGDELFLGKTKMAGVRTRAEGLEYDYVLGRDDEPEYDHVSEPYREKEDARQDCETHVRGLLSRAGA